LLVRAQKRLEAPGIDDGFLSEQIRTAERRLRQAQAERRRLPDAFQSGFVRREEFEERARTLAGRIGGLENDREAL
jgi:multidrug resistance efflux pump